MLLDGFDWAKRTAPFFEAADADLTRAYHYRWRVFFMHAKHTRRDGWVVSEFLRHVGWAGPHGSINCAYGHHAADARWLRDPRILDDYSTFWWRHPKADKRYTWWPAHAAYERYRLDGRVEPLQRLYPQLVDEYTRWVNRSSIPDGHGKGQPCLWQACHDDGEENSVGFDGCRPTIAAAVAGEAGALAAISFVLYEHAATTTADASSDGKRSRRRQRDAATTPMDRAAMRDAGSRFAISRMWWQRSLHKLWSKELQFFVTRTRAPPPSRSDDIRARRTKLGCQYCGRPRRVHARAIGQEGEKAAAADEAMECPPRWKEGELVRARELSGLSWPWYHRLAAPEHAVAWSQLRAAGGFAGAWGLTTVERRHPCYNFSTSCVTSWNGPVWPFESAKLLTGLAHALHELTHARALEASADVGKAAFADALMVFGRMHTRGRAAGVASGEPFVGESFHPDDGYWLTRELLHRCHAADRNRGAHYLHSSFADLVLGGLVGIHVELGDEIAKAEAAEAGRSAEDEYGAGGEGPKQLGPMAAQLVVDPLFEPSQLPWLHVAGVLVRGREVAVVYDRDGTRFGKGKGLAVWLDGALVAQARAPRRVVVPLK